MALTSAAAPSAIATAILARARSTWSDGDMRRIFWHIEDRTYTDFKRNRVDKFINEQGEGWEENFDGEAVAASNVFKDFEDEVAEECEWMRSLTIAERVDVLVQMIYYGVKRLRHMKRLKQSTKSSNTTQYSYTGRQSNRARQSGRPRPGRPNKRKREDTNDGLGGQTAPRGEPETLVDGGTNFRGESEALTDTCLNASRETLDTLIDSSETARRGQSETPIDGRETVYRTDSEVPVDLSKLTYRQESEPIVVQPTKRENSVIPSFVPVQGSAGEPGTSLHLQFLRLSNGTEPPIAYQTKLADMAPEIDASRDKDLFQWLDFKKLIATARQKIWFVDENELLACDGCTEQKPRDFLSGTMQASVASWRLGIWIIQTAWLWKC